MMANVGRPTKYDDTFPLRAEGFARRGMIDKEIAQKLGIHIDTLYEYQKRFSEFSDAIKRGKFPVDVEVENALLKRARGFEYEEIQTEYNVKDLKDDEQAKPVKVRRTKKIVVGDVTAQIFWSKNRRPQLWKDRHNIDVTGDMNIKVISAVTRSGKKKT